MLDSPEKALEEMLTQALEALKAVTSSDTLAQWKTTYLGRSSAVMSVFSNLGKMPADIRPLMGQKANQVKIALETAMNQAADAIHKAELQKSLESESLDVTLPGRPAQRGRIHPAMQNLRDIYKVFADMGFQVYRSPDVETDEFNFELLNIPEYHPARDMWQTFYTTKQGVLLRTHTSPGQIWAMKERCPESIRVILPGMCYRYEQITTRSEIQFHQVEGLMVGRNVTFSDLKGTLTDFVRRLFGRNVKTRFRPSYFPFTEPSAEMDMECFLCGGEGCSVCKNAGWLEILGCGMVHPVVLSNGGYDPEIYSGFAFGLGPERITMLRRHIDDIRYFWGNDMRFLEQF
jgi:phenylalanyl-tRNA synthetase alpha chain